MNYLGKVTKSSYWAKFRFRFS